LPTRIEMLSISEGMTMGYGYFMIYQNTLIGRIAHRDLTQVNIM
jgi:hypothetical protein